MGKEAEMESLGLFIVSTRTCTVAWPLTLFILVNSSLMLF